MIAGDPFPGFHSANLSFSLANPAKLTSAQLVLSIFNPEFDTQDHSRILVHWSARVDRAHSNVVVNSIDFRDEWIGLEFMSTNFPLHEIRSLFSAQLAIVASGFHPDASESHVREASSEFLRRRAKDRGAITRSLPPPINTTISQYPPQLVQQPFIAHPLPSRPQQSRFSSSNNAVVTPLRHNNGQLPSPTLSAVARGKKRALEPEVVNVAQPYVQRGRDSMSSGITEQVFNTNEVKMTQDEVVPNFLTRNFTTLYLCQLPVSKAELLQLLSDQSLPKIMILSFYSKNYDKGPTNCALVLYEHSKEAQIALAFVRNLTFGGGATIFAVMNDRRESSEKVFKWSQVTEDFRKKYKEGKLMAPPRANPILTASLDESVPVHLLSKASLILIGNLPYNLTSSELKQFISSNSYYSEECIGMVMSSHGTASLLFLTTTPSGVDSLMRVIKGKEIRKGFPIRPQSLSTLIHNWYWNQMSEEFRSRHGRLPATPAILPFSQNFGQNSIDRDGPESKGDHQSINHRNGPSLLKFKFIESTGSRKIPRRLELKNHKTLGNIVSTPQADVVKLEAREGKSAELEMDELLVGPVREKVWEVLEVSSDSEGEW